MKIVAAAIVLMIAQGGQERFLDGKLHGLAFGRDEVAGSDAERVPQPLRTRLQDFIARRDAFTSRIPPGAGEDPDGKDLWASRRGIERAIVALSRSRGIEAEAERFARAVPLRWEYEGHPDGPLEEARFAEDYLKKNPEAPMAGYLYVFIAARERVAFEAYAQPSPPVSAAAALDGMKATARKYRAFIQRARAHEDPLIGLIAEDLDLQPMLHVRTGKHPRDFDPDT